MCIIIEVS